MVVIVSYLSTLSLCLLHDCSYSLPNVCSCSRKVRFCTSAVHITQPCTTLFLEQNEPSQVLTVFAYSLHQTDPSCHHTQFPIAVSKTLWATPFSSWGHSQFSWELSWQNLNPKRSQGGKWAWARFWLIAEHKYLILQEHFHFESVWGRIASMFITFFPAGTL